MHADKITVHLRSELDLYPTVASYIEAHGIEQYLENYNDEILVIENMIGNFPCFNSYHDVDEWEVHDVLTQEYADDLEAGLLAYKYYSIQDYLNTFKEYEAK